MKSLIVGFLIVFALGLVALMTMSSNTSNKTNEMKQEPLQQESSQSTAPMPTAGTQLIAGKTYSAIIHTEIGDMTVQLNAEQTPITVNNFVSLARKGFYENTVFHRVVKDFMIQGGDPKGDGTGGPGYQFDDEPFEGEYTRGTIAMANSGPNTNGSQFFIMHADYQLPKNYVIFGKLTNGLDILDAIATAETKMNAQGNEKSTPLKPITVTSIEILEE